MVVQRKILEFEWDKGNVVKNFQKHGISPNEAESIFLDENLGVEKDVNHSEIEPRFIAFGKTIQDKILFVVFTLRGQKIRIISARVANKKERKLYEKAKKNTKI